MEINEILIWRTEWLIPVASIAAVTIAFITYYFVMISPGIERRVKGELPEDQAVVRWIVFQRIWGGAILGLFALLTPVLGWGAAPVNYGMSFAMNGATILLVLGMGVVIVLINLLRAGSPNNLKQYPQIRNAHWDGKTLLLSSLGWVVYLLGYELMFRGLLLYGCVEVLGIWPAIAVNTAIYSFAHFFKGVGETVGAIPFGILICCLSLYTGNFMLAFIVHCFLALSNQTVAMWKHPQIRFSWKNGSRP